jgi:glycosyltransferase involved in cell wall biosynthesis
VFDHHDLFPELLAEKFGESPLVRVAAASQRASLRLASSVIVTNESQARLARQRGGRSGSDVTVVRNGPRRPTLASPGWRDGPLAEPRLVFVGTLGSQDGVLELAGLLRHPELAGARLTVVGDGESRPELASRLAAAGVRDRVRFTGLVSHDRIPALIEEADICVDPAPCNALNHASTMIKVGEYLAGGRPIVAYDLFETRRTAGDAALYADCGDPSHFASLVADLAQNGELRERIGRRAIARAEDLVWERSEVALLKVYDRL